MNQVKTATNQPGTDLVNKPFYLILSSFRGRAPSEFVWVDTAAHQHICFYGFSVVLGFPIRHMHRMKTKAWPSQCFTFASDHACVNFNSISLPEVEDEAEESDESDAIKLERKWTP